MIAYPVDGRHIDQLGNQGLAYTYAGNLVNLLDTYRGIIDSAKAVAGKKLVFNAVRQYGQQQFASQEITETEIALHRPALTGR